MLSFKGVPLHENDFDAATPGRRFFAVKEERQGKASLRLQRLCPRNVRGQAQPVGLLGAFGEGQDCTVRTAMGAVVVLPGPNGLVLSECPLHGLMLESAALELALARGGEHAN